MQGFTFEFLLSNIVECESAHLLGHLKHLLDLDVVLKLPDLEQSALIRLVDKMHGCHQVHSPGVDQQGKASFAPGLDGLSLALHEEVFLLVLLVFKESVELIHNLILAAEFASGQRVVAQNVGNQAPVVAKQAVVPLDQLDFGRIQFNVS